MRAGRAHIQLNFDIIADAVGDMHLLRQRIAGEHALEIGEQIRRRILGAGRKDELLRRAFVGDGAVRVGRSGHRGDHEQRHQEGKYGFALFHIHASLFRQLAVGINGHAPCFFDRAVRGGLDARRDDLYGEVIALRLIGTLCLFALCNQCRSETIGRNGCFAIVRTRRCRGTNPFHSASWCSPYPHPAPVLSRKRCRLCLSTSPQFWRG